MLPTFVDVELISNLVRAYTASFVRDGGGDGDGEGYFVSVFNTSFFTQGLQEILRPVSPISP
jgi:hypothetical protein